MTEPRTFGELKAMLALQENGDWPSRINKSMTHTQALDIFKAAVKGHADDERCDASTHRHLIAKNVMRECTIRGVSA